MPEVKNRVLIEIGAQHPLIDGKPGEEFALRLEKGIELFKIEQEKGNEPIIYVPGSLHSVKVNGEWQTDKNSLSTAGRNFLLEHGIPAECICSDDANERFKQDGVYNSGDECLVAKQLANERGIDRIISVASPVQVYRKALFYLEYGFEPEMYGVGLENTFHNYVGESFWSLYITYFIDHTWQDSFLAVKTREERNRNYQITREIQELIDTGINLPDIVKAKKAEWMELYKKAQENMKNRSNNEGLVIGVTAENEKTKAEKIETILAICTQHENKDITICVQGKEYESFMVALKSVVGNRVKIEIVPSYEDELKFYEESLASRLYHVTDSPTGMKDAILAIQKGIIPIIFSSPNQELSYVDNIQELYLDIFQIEKKREDKSTGEYGEDDDDRR